MQHSAGRTRALEAGLGLVVVATPIVFFPAATAPYADPKLVCLLAGALLIVLGTTGADRRILGLATAWVGAAALATLTGVDQWRSLVGTEAADRGLLMILACAVLVVAGTGLPDDLAERVPRWIFWTAAGLAPVTIARPFVPLPFGLDYGATLGNPVIVGGLMAAGIASAPCLELTSRQAVAGTALLTSALAVSTNRTGWLAAAAGVMVGIRSARPPRNLAVAIGVSAVVVLIGWTAVDAAGVLPVRASGAYRFSEVGEGTSANERPHVWSAATRAWWHRPMLGWGPANTWSAYLSSATRAEIHGAGRSYGDAHNIGFESLATTGAVGAGALLALAWGTLWRARRSSFNRPWALAVGASLVVTHSLQPLSLPLTSLLFLCAGAATRGRVASVARRRIGRSLVVAVLVTALGCSVVRVTASVLERQGRDYNSAWALRQSLRLEPWRLSSKEALALGRALDARSHDATASREAKRLVSEAVAEHPWDPGVRIHAANVDVLLEDVPGADAWLEGQIAMFPNDPAPLAAAAALALRRGDRTNARRLAKRSVDIRPTKAALEVLKRTR